MSVVRTFRTVFRAGLCALVLVASAAPAAALDDPSKMLEYADSIKSAKSDEFAGILAQLEAGAAQLSPNQALYLRYLRAWQIGYGGDKLPTREDVERLHHLAHEQCFIANSIKTEVVVSAVDVK